MPAGIIIILILAVLVFFDYVKTDIFVLSKVKTVLLLIAFTVAYMLRPVLFNGIIVYWQSFLLITVFSIYLLSKTNSKLKALLLSVISAVILWIFSQKLSPQPAGLIYEPFFIYALILSLINILFRLSVLNSMLSISLFNLLLLFTKDYNVLLPHDAFSAICISALLSSVIIKGSVKNASCYSR